MINLRPKNKNHGEEGNERVYIKEMIEEWKHRNGENYAEVFADKLLKKRPLIKVKLKCQSLHTKGL